MELYNTLGRVCVQMLVWDVMNLQYTDDPAPALDVDPRVKDFGPRGGLDRSPSGCSQLLSPGNIRSVSAGLIWALKT